MAGVHRRVNPGFFCRRSIPAACGGTLEYGAIRRLPMRSAAPSDPQARAPAQHGDGVAPVTPIGVTEISRGSSEANTPGCLSPEHDLHPERGA
jgi:hypothetical protein